MDLNEMRAQRAKLDEQIKATEAEQAADWNFALENLAEALWTYAQSHDLTVTDSIRKNVTTVVLEGRVSVEFGRDDGEHAAFLAAGDDEGIRVEFNAPSVIADRFFDFIGALLGREVTP